MSGPILLILRAALALALYAFLAWALYTLWQELRRQSKVLNVSPAPPLTLIRQSNGDKKAYRFTAQEVTIGRDPACNFYLEDQTISAQHARLAYHHGQWWIEDLNSTNGTFVNQESLSEPVVITAGDQLRFGQVVMQVSIEEADPQVIETGV